MTGSEAGARGPRSSRPAPSTSPPYFLNLELFHMTKNGDRAIDAPASPAAASAMAARFWRTPAPGREWCGKSFVPVQSPSARLWDCRSAGSRPRHGWPYLFRSPRESEDRATPSSGGTPSPREANMGLRPRGSGEGRHHRRSGSRNLRIGTLDSPPRPRWALRPLDPCPAQPAAVASRRQVTKRRVSGEWLVTGPGGRSAVKSEPA